MNFLFLDYDRYPKRKQLQSLKTELLLVFISYSSGVVVPTCFEQGELTSARCDCLLSVSLYFITVLCGTLPAVNSRV